MGWSQELSDFSEGFGAGSKMVDSRSDRELKKLEAEERKQRIRRGEIELSPDFIERERREQEAGIAGTEAQTDVNRQAAKRAAYENTDEYRAWEKTMQEADVSFKTESAKKLAFENSDEFRDLQRRETEAGIEGTEATTEVNRQTAERGKYENTPEFRALEKQKTEADISASEATTRYNAALAAAKEHENTPQQREYADAARAAETELKQATARQTRAAAALDEAKVTPERLKAADAAAAEELAGAGATRAKTEAETEELNLKNQQTKHFMEILEGKTRDVGGRAALPEVYDPNQAVETDDTPDPDAEEPATGPTSAVEVPGETMSTTEATEPVAGAGVPVEAAVPIAEEEQVAGLSVEATSPEPPPAEEEAVSTTRGAPVTSEGKPRAKDRNVPLREAGPRAHPHVDEQQDRMAATRKQRLDPSTVNVLEYAGANTGINAVVYSGGQAGKGEKGPRTGSTRHDHGLAADVRLHDAKTGRLLDMRNPEDAQRMRDFGMYAVQAGATGIGAGEGYMGNSSMHIGFGKEASWGGAPWIQDALEQGKATRDKMTSMPGGSDVTKMFQDGSIHQSARNATLAGMKYTIGSHGLDQDSAVNTPENDDAAYSFLSGDFGADAEQVEEVENVVQNIAREAGFEVNEAEKPMYALAAVYEAYLAVGKPEEAEKAAAALYGHYKKLFGQYGAVAKAAMAQGDIDAAVEAAAKAYANVPDGYDVTFNEVGDGRYEVVMTNQETKEVTHRQIATPQEIGGLIMEINPGHFDQFIASAAGAKEKEGALSSEFTAAHPELEGMTIGEAKEHRLIGGGTDEDTGVSTGGGKGKGTGTGLIEIDTPEKRAEVATQVKDSLTKFVGNISESETTDTTDAERLNPESNTDMLMYIRPVMEEVAVQNYGKVAPDIVVEAIVNMSEQAPAAAKILPDDQTIEVTVQGSPPIKMQKELYYRLADARSRYGGTGQAESDQRLRDIRSAPEFAPGFVPDYDPTRFPVGGRTGPSAVPVEEPREIFQPRGHAAQRVPVAPRPTPARPRQPHPREQMYRR